MSAFGRIIGNGIFGGGSGSSDTAFVSTVNGLSPAHWWRMNESVGAITDEIGAITLTPGVSHTRGPTSFIPALKSDRAIANATASAAPAQFNSAVLPSTGDFTLWLLYRIDADGANGNTNAIFNQQFDSSNRLTHTYSPNSNNLRLLFVLTGTTVFNMIISGTMTPVAVESIFITRTGSSWNVYRAGAHGVAAGTETGAGGIGTPVAELMGRTGAGGQESRLTVSEVISWNSVLTEANMDALYAATDL